MSNNKRKKFVCPECGSSEVRWRNTMQTYICKRCGNVFGSYKEKSKPKPKKQTTKKA